MAATIDAFTQCSQEDEGASLLMSGHYPLLDYTTPYLLQSSSSCAKLEEEAPNSCSGPPMMTTDGSSELVSFLELLDAQLLEDSDTGIYELGDELLNEYMSHEQADRQEHSGGSENVPMQRDAVPAQIPSGDLEHAITREGSSVKPRQQKRVRKPLPKQPPTSLRSSSSSLRRRHCHVSDEDTDEGKPSKSSKNLNYERQRRGKLNANLYTLRALVPNISKMDKASIVSDAVEYVQNLKKQVKDAEEEILALTLWRHIVKKNIAKGIATHTASIEQIEQKIVEVDLTKVEGSIYQLKVVCLSGHTVIRNLSKALDALDFDILNANVTTVNEYIFSTIFLEVKNAAMLEPMELRDMILKVSLMFGLGIAEN